MYFNIIKHNLLLYIYLMGSELNRVYLYYWFSLVNSYHASSVCLWVLWHV